MELIDKQEIFRPYEAPCLKCKNKFESENYSCLAFPKGIPDVILTGKDQHAKPLPGQKNSLTFTPKH